MVGGFELVEQFSGKSQLALTLPVYKLTSITVDVPDEGRVSVNPEPFVLVDVRGHLTVSLIAKV